MQRDSSGFEAAFRVEAWMIYAPKEGEGSSGGGQLGDYMQRDSGSLEAAFCVEV